MAKPTYQQIMEMLHKEDALELAALAQGRCPACGEKGITIKVSGNQGGYSPVPGTWHEIRCELCDYMTDRILNS